MSRPVKASRSNAKAKRKGSRKADQALGDGEGLSGSKICPLKYGYVSILRRKRVMEDPVMVVPPRKLPGGYSFFAAYGGRDRAKVGEVCTDKLHRCLAKHTAETKEKELGWGKVVMDCFSNMFEEEAAPQSEGTTMKFTAVVVGAVNGEVVLVNCGGSRAVLWSGGVASPLWNDNHIKRDENVVEATISRNDGVVSQGDEEGERRSELEARVTRRNDKSEELFVIIATDGLWNVVGKEMACEVVRKCVGGKMRRLPSEGAGASQAAALLAELAIAKGSKDNISIIVVQPN